MKQLKKYLPILLLLAFVAVLIAVALGVSRRGPVAPTAPSSKPSAASCLLSFEIAPLNCNGTCTETTQCGTGMTCYKENASDTSGFCRNTSCQTASNCICVTPTPTPTPTPICNSVCSSDSSCATGMICNKTNSTDATGFCRNPNCTTSNTCACTTPTPTPTPTDTPKGGFYIRKYYDHNGNGKQDSGDEGLTWKFQWTKDNGNTWNDYDTDAAKLGEGGVVYLDGGVKVQIKEKSQDSWTATTPTTVDLTIRLNDNQLFVFGNWHGATPTPTPAPGCNSACATSSDCPSSMNCISGSCRNPSCSTSTSCVCQTTTTPTPTPTPEKLPVSGAVDDTLKLVAAGIGAVLLGLIGLLAL